MNRGVRWKLPDQSPPGVTVDQIQRYNCLQKHVELMCPTDEQRPTVSSMLMLKAPLDSMQLIRNTVRRCNIRNKIPEEMLQRSPQFVQERYLATLTDEIASSHFDLLGSKADVSELLTSRYVNNDLYSNKNHMY